MAAIYVPLNENIFFDMTTESPSTGGVVNADSTPTFKIFEEADDTPIASGSFTARTSQTGVYRATTAFSSGAGFEVGKYYSVVGEYTASSVARKQSLITAYVVPQGNEAITDATVWAYSTRTLTASPLTASDVWNNPTRTLTSGGGGGATAQEVWEYVTRTLTAATNITEDGQPVCVLYHARIELTVDGPNTRDEWTVQWYKNGVALTSAAIGNPTLIVIKRADGTDLVPQIPMTSIGTLGAYKHDVTGTQRITPGEAVIVYATGLIDSVIRVWPEIITRDSA